MVQWGVGEANLEKKLTILKKSRACDGKVENFRSLCFGQRLSIESFNMKQGTVGKFLENPREMKITTLQSICAEFQVTKTSLKKIDIIIVIREQLFYIVLLFCRAHFPLLFFLRARLRSVDKQENHRIINKIIFSKAIC